MAVVTLRPPAKLNRFLHIVGRREDGYHQLQTAFELIDWCDELKVETRDDGVIERVGGMAGVAADDDLVVRAARVLQGLAAPGSGCTLTLQKQVPAGAGLGGGSSDAAAVLLALNQMWGLNLDLARLIGLGVRLGADVPVFLGQGPAFAEGIGEQLTPLPFVARHYAVVYPGIGLATGPMFKSVTLRRDCPPMSLADYLRGASTTNVFLPVALAEAPEVAAAATWLYARFGNVHLTGSGSALYAEVDSRLAAESGLADASPQWRVRAASAIANWFDNRVPGT